MDVNFPYLMKERNAQIQGGRQGGLVPGKMGTSTRRRDSPSEAAIKAGWRQEQLPEV